MVSDFLAHVKARPNIMCGQGPLAGIQDCVFKDDIYKLYVCEVIHVLYFLDCSKVAC